MLSTLHSSAGFLVTAPFAMARTKQKVRPRQRESISSRNGSAEQTDRLLPMNEFEVFSGTPRKRTKPTVPLDNVLVSHASTSTPVDLFDALFKGPFSATGIYTESADCAIPCNQPTPCAVQSSNVAKFAIEEASTSNPPGVKIYFEGGLAWYEIISVHPSYASIFADMRLKARLWLWVQHRRSAILTKSSTRKRWPTLKQISHDVPWHLKTRIHDPIDTFHAYLIEQILQSHLEQEKLAVGPPDVDPKWSKCQLFLDLEEKYPGVWRSIEDRMKAKPAPNSRVPRLNNEEPLSPVSMRAKVQKPSKQTRYIQRLFEANADTIKDTPDLVSAATVILDYIHPSHYDVQELIENFENHAEVLLTGLTLVDQFKDWPGLEEIRSFIKDKKWWKRRQVIQQEPSPPPRRAAPGRRRVFSEEHSVEPNTPKDDSETANASQDELTAETPIEYPRTAKKGTSVLRPRYSMSRTPGTPTRQVDQESEPSSTDMHPHSGPITDAEEELQLLQLPADVSQRIQNEKKTLTRKRKFDHEPVEKVFKRPRNTQTDEPTDFFSVKFGRGRPPLTTVMVCPTLLDSLQLPLSNDQTTTFCCTFPECTYTRVCSSSMSAKAAIDKHHRMHQSEIRDALEMLKDPFIIGGRVGGEKGNRLVRPIGGVDHLVERIEEMAKGLGGTPSKRLVV